MGENPFSSPSQPDVQENRMDYLLVFTLLRAHWTKAVDSRSSSYTLINWKLIPNDIVEGQSHAYSKASLAIAMI